MNFRVGSGHDSHRLADGGPLLLSGVEIPHDKHAVGHSDADVLLHAVTDAILGAVAAGDIGELFPDSAEENRGRDSADFLREALARTNDAGFEIVNLDCTVFAERPKIGPHREAIRTQLAALLKIGVDGISVKAKTGEGVGPIGREEAIAAEAVVLMRRRGETRV